MSESSGSMADGRSGRVAAIYARVSSERQRRSRRSRARPSRCVSSPLSAGCWSRRIWCSRMRASRARCCAARRLSGCATVAVEGRFEVLLCHAPDRLARRYAYQVLLLEEFQRAGVEVIFAKEPERSGTPEDELLRQFQGMIAEYERAQIAERCRRGKLHRARAGAVSVLARRTLRLPVCEEVRARRRVLRDRRGRGAGRARDLPPLPRG